MRITNAFPNFLLITKVEKQTYKVNNVKYKLNPRGSILNQNGNSDHSLM